MYKLRLWLILGSIGLISIDKYSFISSFRDSVTVYIQKHAASIEYQIISYPRLFLLQKTQQQKLETENHQLKRQVEQYALLLKQNKNQTQDIKELHNLTATNLYEDFQQIIARAVIDINYLINNKLLIDKGEADKIAVGYAVVNKDGVVGQVSLVNKKNSQISLIVNPNFKIYLQDSITKEKMLADGAGSHGMIIKYIAKSTKVKVGDILTTTGLDDIFPANIPVAKITKLFYENNGFNSALCQPIVNFDSLQYVSVLKNAN